MEALQACSSRNIYEESKAISHDFCKTRTHIIVGGLDRSVQSCNIDQDIIGREIVEHVSLGFGPEGQKPTQGHGKTHDHGYPGRIMRDEGKAVHRGFSQ